MSSSHRSLPRRAAEPSSTPGWSGLGAASLLLVRNQQTRLEIDEAAVRDWVSAAARRLDRRVGDLIIQIVDDAAIRIVNRRHLNHDWATDVVTFPTEEPGGPEIAGELIISAETALRVAAELNVNPLAELALYLVHGLLHLAGWDDQSDQQRREMRRWESELLRLMGWERPGGEDLMEHLEFTTAGERTRQEAGS